MKRIAKNSPDTALQRQIQELIKAKGGGANEAEVADIINGQPIHLIPPTPEEMEDTQHLDLPRIAFGFNRHDYGRLRQLIDVLNGL